MSHFTKCALKLTNLAAIKKALADMQLKFAALLRNYIDEQVPHIESIRRSLEASRRGLEISTITGWPDARS